MKKDLTAFEKISHNLFRSQSETEIVLTKDEQVIKERYMLYVTKMLEDPLVTDMSMIIYIKGLAGIEKSQAYRDLANVRSIVGNIKNATKEWHKYMVIEGLKKAHQKASLTGNIIAEIMALDKLGKYCKLDKEDEEVMPWDQIIPPEFEMSSDITVLDSKLAIKNVEERRIKLREKYNHLSSTDFEEA